MGGKEMSLVQHRFQHFTSTVEHEFAFLTQDYLFSLAGEDHARGEIWVEYRSPALVLVHVDFEPGAGVDVTLRLKRHFGTIGANIRDLLPPGNEELPSIPMNDYDDELIAQSVRLYASTLREYGRPVLMAEPVAWEAVKKRAMERRAAAP